MAPERCVPCAEAGHTCYVDGPTSCPGELCASCDYLWGVPWPVRSLSGLLLGRRIVVTVPPHDAVRKPPTQCWGVVTSVEHTADRTSVHLDGIPVVMFDPEQCTFEFVDHDDG